MNAADVLCFSHLRWGFVFQRPNHLMTRYARTHRVFYIEEPLFDAAAPHLSVDVILPNLFRVVPHLPREAAGDPAHEGMVNALLRGLCMQHRIVDPTHWYYTPMMLGLSEGLPRGMVVYDCMDELANFLFAPPQLHAREQRLLREADIVFTGGRALYEAKRDKHPHVHAMPSSVDVAHFAQAKSDLEDPPDQASIPHPRIGYCGVVDERIDYALLEQVAREQPHWQLIMLGPIVKVAPEALPKLPNIHYLGLKTYTELPAYLSGWDVAMMPFALNDATRFISPTKTPEYLAAGKPVVSTAIRDVVEPYERLELVRIGRDPRSFIAETTAALAGGTPAGDARRDAFLAGMSWDATWSAMERLLSQTQLKRAGSHSQRAQQDGSYNV